MLVICVIQWMTVSRGVVFPFLVSHSATMRCDAMMRTSLGAVGLSFLPQMHLGLLQMRPRRKLQCISRHTSRTICSMSRFVCRAVDIAIRGVTAQQKRREERGERRSVGKAGGVAEEEVKDRRRSSHEFLLHVRARRPGDGSSFFRFLCVELV